MGQIVTLSRKTRSKASVDVQPDSRTAGQLDSWTAIGQIVTLSCRAKPLYPLCHLCDTTRQRLLTCTVSRVCATGFIYSIFRLYIAIIYMTI